MIAFGRDDRDLDEALGQHVPQIATRAGDGALAGGDRHDLDLRRA